MDFINWTNEDIGDILDSESEVGDQEVTTDAVDNDDGMSDMGSDEDVDVGLPNSD